MRRWLFPALGVIAIGLWACGVRTPTERESRAGSNPPVPDIPFPTPLPTPPPSNPGPGPGPGTGTPGAPQSTPRPATIEANLKSAKRRTNAPAGYSPLTLDEIRALPLYGPDYTPNELRSIQDLEANGVRLEGELIYYVRVADGGTYDRPASRGDWHLEIREPSIKNHGQTADKNVVVEITPHFQETRPGWDEAMLRRLARFHGTDEINPAGQLVRIYGWLMNDYVHEDLAGAFRGTSWEVHPITRIEWFDPTRGGWVEIE